MAATKPSLGHTPPIDATLIGDVDLLCLDAGNTVVFLDHDRLAAVCRRAGFDVSAPRLVHAEGLAKIAVETGRAVAVEWSSDVAGARSWAAVVGTMLERAGLAPERVSAMLAIVWEEHRAYNFWSRVPPGLTQALAAARSAGVKVAVVSNSEGTLADVLEDVGLLGSFDLVLDSGLVGVEKPDPAIFRLALDRFRVPAGRALHLGDTYATDVVGARAAGVRVALVDPHGHFEGRHLDVPRVPGAPAVAEALATGRAREAAFG